MVVTRIFRSWGPGWVRLTTLSVSTDFGKIDTSPTGLLHLLVAEFGLIYGSDWFMLPYPLGINMIEPAGAGTANDRQKWAMFYQTDLSTAAPANHLFYLAPAVRESLINDPLEVVNFLRDEVAEMVWAVENRVPSQAGHGVSGNLYDQRIRPEVRASRLEQGGARLTY